MSTYTHIQELLSESLYFTEQDTRDILSRCEGRSDEELQAIVDTLNEASKHQDGMIRQLVLVDPDFPKRLDAFMHNFTKAVKGQVDADESARMEDIIKQLSV